ncbi:MAG: hypothetical protein CL763_05475 [Chloroflexi bacterium]|nr:hypothetical protein [Chloroflexota bacterium]
MQIPKSFKETMLKHALENYPNECCGVLGGLNNTATAHYPMQNAANSPYRYEFEGREHIEVSRQIEANNSEIMCIYHSHTGSEAQLSDTDLRLITYPDSYYLIISLMNLDQPDFRAYKVQELSGWTNDSPATYGNPIEEFIDWV